MAVVSTDRAMEIMLQVLQLAPVELQAVVDELSPEEREAYESVLRNAVQALGWVAGYLSERSNGPGGDRGHAKAALKANQYRRGIRKAMGFTYPNSNDIHV